MHLAAVKTTLIIPVMPLQPPSLELFSPSLSRRSNTEPGFPRSPWPGAGEKDQQQRRRRWHWKHAAASWRTHAPARTESTAVAARARTPPNTPRHTGDAVKLNNPTSGRARANRADRIWTDEVCRKALMWMFRHNVTHTHTHTLGWGGVSTLPELLDQHCQTSSLLKCHNVWDLLYHAQTHTSSTQVHTHFFFFFFSSASLKAPSPVFMRLGLQANRPKNTQWLSLEIGSHETDSQMHRHARRTVFNALLRSVFTSVTVGAS